VPTASDAQFVHMGFVMAVDQAWLAHSLGV